MNLQENEFDSEDSKDAEPSSTGDRLKVSQVSIRTVLLLTALVAMLLGLWRNQLTIQELSQKISVSRKILNDLVVDDEQQYAATKVLPSWYGEYNWDVYLPPRNETGKNYSIKIAVDNIDEGNFPTAATSIPIEPGRHNVRINTARLSVDQSLPVVIDKKDSTSVPFSRKGTSYSSSSNGVETCMQQAVDKPLVLYRMRYMSPSPNGSYTSTKGPVEGVMIWVERE